MPYDKIVDSAKLDGALTATADTIRGKTGGTAKIAWNETTGFSAAITTQNKSVTPKASSQTIKPDAGYIGLGQVTVNGDADLKAANIAKGVNIFGVTGTLESGYRVATGSYTAGEYNERFNNGITITGLGFKPSLVFFYDAGDSQHTSINNMMFLRNVEIGVTNTYVYDDSYIEEDSEEAYTAIIRANLSSSTVFGTLNDDGFTIQSATSYRIYLGATHTYYYVAIG
jgi:hypothetical protein